MIHNQERGPFVRGISANLSFDEAPVKLPKLDSGLADLGGRVVATDEGECWRCNGPMLPAVLQYLMQQPDCVRPDVLRSSHTGPLIG